MKKPTGNSLRETAKSFTISSKYGYARHFWFKLIRIHKNLWCLSPTPFSLHCNIANLIRNDGAQSLSCLFPPENVKKEARYAMIYECTIYNQIVCIDLIFGWMNIRVVIGICIYNLCCASREWNKKSTIKNQVNPIISIWLNSKHKQPKK